ncbi:AAA family ATPase [Actinopolymorpha pittospori]
MRLHRLAMRDFRGVVERELTFDETGVTVVVGDNETGKSSLLEALALLFELPDDSKAAKLRSVQPVGRDVGSEVEAEVTLGETRVHYRKQWFRQRATELRTEPDGRTWTGREAHDEAVRLFREHVDQTLWTALVVGQEHALAVPAAGSVAAVLTALDEAAGGEVDHGASVPLVAAVETEYLRYFTRTGRPTGDYAEAVTRRDEQHARLEEATAGLAEVEQDVTRAERLGRDRGTLATRLAEQRLRVAELESRRHAADELIGQVERLRRDSELATQHLDAARGERQRRETLVGDVRQREEAATTALEAARRAGLTLHTAELEWQAATTRLHAARQEHATQRAVVRSLDVHLTRLRDRSDLTELQARLAAVEDARSQEHQAAAALQRSPVDAAAVEAAEAAHLEVLAAQAALAAGSPTLVLRRLGPGEIEVAGEPLDGLTESAESPAEVVVERDTTVRAGDLVELTVRPGAGAAELAAARARAEHAESRLLAELGQADIAAVRRAGRARVEAERALAGARETLTRRLDGRTFEELLAERDVLAARVAGAVQPENAADEDAAEETAGDAAEDATVEPPVPDTIEATRTALVRAQEEESAATQVSTEAEAAEAAVRKEFEAAREEATETRVRAEQAVERRDDARASLLLAREERGDDTLAEAVRKAAAEAEGIATELAQAADTMSASGVDLLDERLIEATRLREQLAGQVEELQDELRLVEGRLEMAGAQGLASAVERANAELAHAQQHHDTLARRAAAASRLRDTLERHRAESRRRYAAPLRARIDALGRVVHGSSFGVALGDDLEVEARVIDGLRLPVSSLSTGAREQLATIVRLAIAGLTAVDGSGVPVVLDDALGWSDPGRLEAMGALLARAGTTGQVILLTCAPDRYVGTVPGARVVRI